MNFEQALAHKLKLEANAQTASDALNEFPSGTMGLTPDHIKQSPEFIAARAAYNAAANALKEFNKAFLKVYKKQYTKHLRAQRGR